MRLDALATWRPGPGRLLRVRPTAATTAAAANAPVDPGPPTFLQADHLAAHAARDGTHPHRAWTGVAADVPARFDPDAWRRALARFLVAHPGHRTWFAPATHVRHLVGVEVAGVPEAYEVAEVLTGASPTTLAAYLEDRPWPGGAPTLSDDLSATCTPDSWPGWALLVVDRGADFAFLWACDHAFTDAASQLLLGGELPGLYEEELARRTAWAGGPVEAEDGSDPAREAGPRTYADDERARAARCDPARSPEVAAWREAVVRHGGLPRSPLDLGLVDGEPGPVRIVRAPLVAGAAAVAALDRAAKAHGARVPSAVVAACALTEARLTGADHWLGVTVLGTRETGPWATAQGWFCTFAPVLVELGPDADLATVLPRAEGAFAAARRTGALPVHAALGAMLADGTLGPDAVGSPQLFSYLDLRWFPAVGAPGLAGAAESSGLHFTGEGRTRNASLWFNRDHEELYVLCQVPDNPTALRSVTAYVGSLAALLRGLAAGAPGEPLVGALGASHLG